MGEQAFNIERSVMADKAEINLLREKLQKARECQTCASYLGVTPNYTHISKEEHEAAVAELRGNEIVLQESLKSMDRYLGERIAEVKSLTDRLKAARVTLECMKYRFDQARDPNTGWVYDKRESGVLLALEDDINHALKKVAED